MDINSYINSTYTIEKYFGRKKNIMLIRSKIDNNLYVLKCIKVYERAIYDMLRDNNIEGIPHIYELMESPEKIYIVESYISGKNIDEYLHSLNNENEWKNNKEEIFISIICRICSILTQIHELDPPVIHRDIKPENIIISEDGSVHLVDFNIARRYTGVSQKDTVAMGTSYFAAPEQYGSGESDNKTDIYGLGATVKYLATNNGINSEKINAFISICMEYAPESRFESAEAAKSFLLKKDGTLKKADKKWKKMIPFNYICNNCGENISVNSYRRFVMCPKCKERNVFDGFKYRQIDWNSSAYSEVELWTDCPVCRSPNMYLGPEGKKWKCPDCGYILGKEEKDEMVIWLCDECETYLNIQEGFNTEKGIWKCTECGFENDVTDDNII
jgi:serine/threonine protein kinase